ncbi:MAG: COG4705 family protein [Acidimicrobiales bacterium]
MPVAPRHALSWFTVPGTLRVSDVTAAFWVVKGLSTAMGEATSDFLVHTIDPVVAVLLGFAAFLVALTVQFHMRRYLAWAYWSAVAMVGVFGTMAADVLHVAVGVPYPASTAFYAVVLAAVFGTWWWTERTLSMHRIDTARRELFYWGAVVATFAMGTALGDLTAYTFNLGYFPSAAIFAGLIVVPAVGYRWFRWNAVFSFWFAYVVTRPLGASIADGLGKPASVSGLGIGDGWVALAFGVAIVAMVAYLAATRADVQRHPTPGLRGR